MLIANADGTGEQVIFRHETEHVFSLIPAGRRGNLIAVGSFDHGTKQNHLDSGAHTGRQAGQGPSAPNDCSCSGMVARLLRLVLRGGRKINWPALADLVSTLSRRRSFQGQQRLESILLAQCHGRR